MEKISYPKNLQSFINEAVAKIKVALDPDFILIAGSFGKNAWLYDKDELISDFEFVFVCNKSWSLKRKKLLLNELNRLYPYEISLKGYLTKKVYQKIISNYSFRNPGYVSLDFYDTFSDQKILFSKNDKSLNILIENHELHVWEAWRLYVNRMGDLMTLSIIEDLSPQLKNYYWLKIFESTADAYLIINKKYEKSISSRIEFFSKDVIEKDSDLNNICKNSFPKIRQALKARKKHNLSLFQIDSISKNPKQIINEWMKYFEDKLAFRENLSLKNKKSWYDNYLNDKVLHGKYSGLSYPFNIVVSNVIKLVNNPKLINNCFLFYRQGKSWRHLILLCVSCIFYEESIYEKKLHESRLIASQMISKRKINSLNNKDFKKTIINYWKILR